MLFHSFWSLASTGKCLDIPSFFVPVVAHVSNSAPRPTAASAPAPEVESVVMATATARQGAQARLVKRLRRSASMAARIMAFATLASANATRDGAAPPAPSANVPVSESGR